MKGRYNVAMIRTESIESLKAIVQIVDVISQYVELHKAGSNYKGLCPFHTEKTPSFVVEPNKGLFYCFGCQKGGDAIKFVMEYEHLEYKDAIEKIAAFYNFALEYSKTQAPQSDALQKLSEFFRHNLLQNPQLLQYLAKRGVSESSREMFGLGFAPQNAEILRFLQGHNYAMSDCLRLGIVGEERGRFYARMVNRLIFPIHSPQGKLVGFGGRSLENTGAKYLNTPQTPLFNKSRLLYGYHLAKEAIYRQRRIIVTEGYIDTILLRQAGFATAVATLGTALGKDHLPLLSKGEPQIIVAYDGDSAGRAAALKAARLLAQKDGGVALLPAGLDPADMVLAKRVTELQAAFDSAVPFAAFVLQEMSARYDLANPLQKEKALGEGNAFLRTLSPLLHEEYAPMFASLLRVSPALLARGGAKKSKDATHAKSDKSAVTLEILKTIANAPNLLDEVLDYIDTPAFIGFEEEFELLKSGQLEHPKILQILLSNRRALPLDELREQLRATLWVYYDATLRQLKAHRIGIDANMRAHMMAQIRDLLRQLNGGEFPRFVAFAFPKS